MPLNGVEPSWALHLRANGLGLGVRPEPEPIAIGADRAERRGGVLLPAGMVKFGLTGNGLWQRLDPLRDGLSHRSGIVPVQPELVAGVKYFGRYRTGWLRDGVLLSVG